MISSYYLTNKVEWGEKSPQPKIYYVASCVPTMLVPVAVVPNAMMCHFEAVPS